VSPRHVRRVVYAVFVAGIVGMIVGSIADNNGVAVTFGLVTAAAALGLILITSVVGADGFARPVAFDERSAEQIESRITALVDAGADEEAVRDLVRDAVRLGRSPR
jgi:hypothetical protein